MHSVWRICMVCLCLRCRHIAQIYLNVPLTLRVCWVYSPDSSRMQSFNLRSRRMCIVHVEFVNCRCSKLKPQVGKKIGVIRSVREVKNFSWHFWARNVYFISLRLSWQIWQEKIVFLNPELESKQKLEMCEREIEQKGYRLMTFNEKKWGRQG